jgi:Dna[CI] antecedent, DciA
MHAARQQAKHASRILVVKRFAKHVGIHDNGRVCGENDVITRACGGCPRFLLRNPSDVILRALAFARRFVDMGRQDVELDSGGAQQLRAPGRRGSQDETHHGHILGHFDGDIVLRVIQVHRFMPNALAEILRKMPLSDHKVSFAWRSSVGPAIDRGTTATLHDGVLRVVVRGAAWGREIERSETLIRARLDSLLGRGVVRALDVQPASEK